MSVTDHEAQALLLAKLEMDRGFIAEEAALVRVYAGMAEACAAIGDDVGLEYSMRQLVAAAQRGLAALADLKSKKREDGHAV